MADALTEEAIVRALKAMALLKADDATMVERLPDQDQWQAYRVCTDGGELLVRSANKETCAAAHFYATTAARYVPDFRPRVLGHDAERGILVEEWLDPGDYKPLAQALLHESTGHGYSTPFRADEFSEVDFRELLRDAGGAIGKIHAGTKGFVQVGNDIKAPATQAGLPEAFMRAARAHPHLANRLRGIAEQSAGVEPVLLHGRLSPGTFLFGQESGEEVAFRDELVAVIGPDHIVSGDPALDLAHMMAHLFLVSVHRVNSIFVEIAGYFQAGYADAVAGPDKLPIMYRAGPLSVAFMLDFLEDARASSFLDPEDRVVISDFSQWWLGRRDYTLGQVRHTMWDAVEAGGVVDFRRRFKSLPRADE